MLVIGLTGGIGSGKSTVADLFKNLGVPVYDADRVARDLVVPGQPALQRIVEVFGRAMLSSDGRLDRAKLRTQVFADAHQRRQLEDILHPAIRQALQTHIAQTRAPYCLLVIPLLFETGQRALVQRTLVVDTPEETQITRTMQRSGLDRAAVQAIMAAQWPQAQRRASADDVIVNDDALNALERQVAELHQNYLQLAAQPPG